MKLNHSTCTITTTNNSLNSALLKRHKTYKIYWQQRKIEGAVLNISMHVARVRKTHFPV